MLISELNPSVRLYNVLMRSGIEQVSQLQAKGDEELMTIHRFTKTLLEEVHAILPKAIVGGRILSMTYEELAEFIDRCTNQDREDWLPIGCSNCTYGGTHHADIKSKDNGQYKCEGCDFENGILGWINSTKWPESG